MKKIIDRVFISLLILIPLFFWSLYFTKSWWQSAVLAIAVTALINMIWIAVSVRIKKTRTPSRLELFRLLSVMGVVESTNLLYNTLPANMKSDLEPPTFVINGDTLVYNNIKFGATSEEDIAKLYRACKAKGLNKAIFIATQTSRSLMTFAAHLGIYVTFPDRYYIKRYLVNHNALPEAPTPVKIKLPKLKPKEIAPVVFDRRKVKYYLFSGFTLLLMSMLTPLKLYYLIFSSVPIALAVISLIIKE
ncbi:MAG TPA: hypothetical protein PKH08_02850 [Clostridia bacterium]|jgi:hypothetical protein|nr:hypothetical protein [Clostridia bacterium]HOK81573.1 hypothetical protein [Clostridia bacterium]HOL61019.1 hypothetical protein [Clostridia bacterium]HPO53389.1 hypothetical protein [Clostridia bacterium]